MDRCLLAEQGRFRTRFGMGDCNNQLPRTSGLLAAEDGFNREASPRRARGVDEPSRPHFQGHRSPDLLGQLFLAAETRLGSGNYRPVGRREVA